MHDLKNQKLHPLYKNQKQVSLHQQGSTRPYMTILKNTYKIQDIETPQPSTQH